MGVCICSAVRGPRRLVLCAGKVYYDLAAERVKKGMEGKIAIVRLEQVREVGVKDLGARSSGCDGTQCYCTPAADTPLTPSPTVHSQLAPFPFDLVVRELRRYPNAEVVWCQVR